MQPYLAAAESGQFSMLTLSSLRETKDKRSREENNQKPTTRGRQGSPAPPGCLVRGRGCGSRGRGRSFVLARSCPVVPQSAGPRWSGGFQGWALVALGLTTNPSSLFP